MEFYAEKLSGAFNLICVHEFNARFKKSGGFNYIVRQIGMPVYTLVMNNMR